MYHKSFEMLFLPETVLGMPGLVINAKKKKKGIISPQICIAENKSLREVNEMQKGELPLERYTDKLFLALATNTEEKEQLTMMNIKVGKNKRVIHRGATVSSVLPILELSLLGCILGTTLGDTPILCSILKRTPLVQI